MTDDRVSSLDDAAELRRQLVKLGQPQPRPVRSALAEGARAQRMVASIEAEAARLRAKRGRALRWTGVGLAAVALLLAGVGVPQWRSKEGAVAIRREQLHPLPKADATGGRPARAGTEPGPAPAPPPLSPRVGVASSGRPALPLQVSATAEPVNKSTLAEENQWFREAAEASRNGDVSAALTRLEQLLREHPQSPLAQTALVRKFRLLVKAGRDEEARHEAERYLTAYPTGFAVREAQAIVSGTAKDARDTSEEPVPP